MAIIVGSGDFKYRIVEDWAKLPPGWSFKEVGAVGVDAKDNVYVFNRGDHPMMIFDREGNFWCVDIPNGRILRVSKSGEFSIAAQYDGWPNGLKFHKDGRLFTPPLDDHILASITREVILEVTDAVERQCTLPDAQDADEAFLASTTREVQPVVAIDDRTYPADGPVSARTAEVVAAHISSRLT